MLAKSCLYFVGNESKLKLRTNQSSTSISIWVCEASEGPDGTPMAEFARRVGVCQAGLELRKDSGVSISLDLERAHTHTSQSWQDLCYCSISNQEDLKCFNLPNKIYTRTPHIAPIRDAGENCMVVSSLYSERERERNALHGADLTG